MPIATINPATGELLREFAPLTSAEIDKRLDLASNAFASWRRVTVSKRAAGIARVADVLDARREDYARLITLEMGRPIQPAREEITKCALACRQYAEHGPTMLRDVAIDVPPNRARIVMQPLGPVLAVMPWNFPFWQVFRFAAPGLAAGNVGLLKHASNVPQCALAIEEVFRAAGFPEGVFQTLLIDSNSVGEIIDDERVRAVTLTGSEPAGSEVASRAARLIKKAVLELGGSDPFIVMPSAEFDDAVRTAVKARVINNGQSCIAAKRFIVHERVYDRFEEEFTAGMRALRVGDPMDPATDVGPLATPAIRAEIESQVRQAVDAGARVLTGGRRIAGPGNYFEPTVLVDVPQDAPVCREEIFGPVAILFRVRDINEAITVANDTPFGLGASVWTADTAEQERFVEEIEAGQVFLNGMVASDPRLPFGGVKHSGYGRELGEAGIREFVNLKTVWCKGSGTV
ncbi:MAG: NAD-dependent succinate-semialdehyde dehydrogenase [Bryobacteraceae bacterium]|jgi:succinate-semialdehyde dehydrogenase/glutarate-semialdehyde dehydrogenase